MAHIFILFHSKSDKNSSHKDEYSLPQLRDKKQIPMHIYIK